jgi:hypothetical protein
LTLDWIIFQERVVDMRKLIGLLIVIVLASIVIYPVIGCPPEPTVEPTIEPTEAPTEEPTADPTIAPTPRHKATEHPPKGDTAPTPWVNGLPDTGGGKPLTQTIVEIIFGVLVVLIVAFVGVVVICRKEPK